MGTGLNIADILRTIKGIKPQIPSLRSSLRDIHKMITEFPPLTSEFARAKRNMLAMLDTIDDDLANALIFTEETEQALEPLLESEAR